MKKRKILKKLSLASLAIVMASAAIFAIIPIGASASSSPPLTTSGLVTPKPYDPTIYTTENGLDIKWGNALPSTYKPSLSSGNLAGFPYFTTNDGTTTYTWVIIGVNPDANSFFNSFAKQLYSQWKENSSSIIGSFANHYFSYADTVSPGGILIENTISSSTYIMDKLINNLIKTNSEISSGCALVLANDIVGSCLFNAGSYNSYYSGSYRYFSQYNYTLRTTMEGYYTNSSLGLGTIKSQIVQQKSMSTKGGVCYSGAQDTEVAIVNDNYIFPLGGYEDEVFYWKDYLTADQIKLSSQFWLRSGEGSHDGSIGYYNVHTITTSGNQELQHCRTTQGIRPAFVLKLQ